MKTIEILVSPEGDIRLVTHGFVGDACHNATHALERALGIIQTDQPTNEMFTTEQEPVHQTG